MHDLYLDESSFTSGRRTETFPTDPRTSVPSWVSSSSSNLSVLAVRGFISDYLPEGVDYDKTTGLDEYGTFSSNT